MSVVFYGFLGRDLQDLENRFLQEFACIGFEVVIHPQMKLLEANGGHLSLAFVRTPPNLKRLHPETPLLTDFEYAVSRRMSAFAQERGWPPRRVRRYTYEICTRTASDRSTASYFAQALTAGILSKITNGQLLEDGGCEVVSGQEGLDSILKNLWRPREFSFDAGAFQFQDWPPIDPIVPVVQPKRLAFSEPNVLLDKSPKQKKLKITIAGAFCTVMFLYFLIVTLLYS